MGGLALWVPYVTPSESSKGGGGRPVGCARVRPIPTEAPRASNWYLQGTPGEYGQRFLGYIVRLLHITKEADGRDQPHWTFRS